VTSPSVGPQAPDGRWEYGVRFADGGDPGDYGTFPTAAEASAEAAEHALAAKRSALALAEPDLEQSIRWEGM
jgi:hypothetical protein